MELTCTSIITDDATALKVLGELRSLGVGVHLDAFGVGFISLSSLRRLRCGAPPAYRPRPGDEASYTFASNSATKSVMDNCSSAAWSFNEGLLFTSEAEVDPFRRASPLLHRSNRQAKAQAAGG